MQWSRQKGGQFRLMDAPPEFGLGGAQASTSLAQGGLQFIQIVGASIGQVVVHLVPHAFIGVEFGRIGGEAFEVEPREPTAEHADRLALVGLAVVPDHDDVATQVTEQMAQEPADLGLLNVLAVKPAVQPQPTTRGADGHRGNG